jgi:ubiquinone/menaquinone biosynthesis C-methylase UbiE
MSDRVRYPVRHPVFAHTYARMAPKFEDKGAAQHREALLAEASGTGIEVGAGTGLNFRHYPTSVTEVLAVEPEPYLRSIAERAAADAPVPVRVVDGIAEALPAADGSFDFGVASLVLCSVRDQTRALGELFRVIRSGGELRFYEHIRAPSAGFARFQRAVDVIWPHLGGGCHTARPTERAIEDAGFRTVHSRHFTWRPTAAALPVQFHVIGRAVRP